MYVYFAENVFQNAQQLRDELWLMLTDILVGDTLAADYLICHLISSVYVLHIRIEITVYRSFDYLYSNFYRYTRQDMLALGKFSLNLSNVPFNLCNSEYVNELYKFLSHLVEKSHFLPITIPYLNSTTMIPK